MNVVLAIVTAMAAGFLWFRLRQQQIQRTQKAATHASSTTRDALLELDAQRGAGMIDEATYRERRTEMLENEEGRSAGS